MSNSLQSGFKKQAGCSDATFALHQCVEYFVERGSSVFMAALDAKKAFDRVNHITLFYKLCDVGISAHVIQMLMNWYSKIFVMVRWCNSLSKCYHVKSGVRQGGILSLLLFNLYIDDIIMALVRSDLGCHIGKCFIGCLVYADDIILLSASLSKLQKMLDICYECGNSSDILFNPKKSNLFITGKDYNSFVGDLHIGINTIARSQSLKYLGVMFNSARHLDVDVDVMIRKFYTASNSILSHAKYMSELSKLYLVESFCLPVLSYSCEAVSYSRNQLHYFNVCWNNTYRKIFGFNKWQSVKLLICFCERVDFIHICAQRKLTFVQHLARLSNDVLSTCVSCFKLSKEFTCLCSDFEVLPTDNLSKGKLRSIVFKKLYAMCSSV